MTTKLKNSTQTLALFACSSLLVLLGSCGGSTGNLSSPSTGLDNQTATGDLPVIGLLDGGVPPRTVSYTSETAHDVDPLVTFSRSANSSDNGANLVLDSSDGNLAWAIYEFGDTGHGSFYYRDYGAGLTIDAKTPDSNPGADFSYFAAIADFGSDNWKFSGEVTDDGEQYAGFPDQDRTTNSGQLMYLAVIVSGGAAIEIEGVSGEFRLAGRILDHIDSRLPPGDLVGIPVGFEIKADDVDGFTVFGFNGSGTISSEPAGVTVIEEPEFDEGSADVIVQFPEIGTYELFLDGAADELDGSLGEILVYETQLPIAEIFIAESDYRDLRIYPYGDEYKPCVFRIDGQEFSVAETRFRGGDARDHPKKSWKVRLPEDAGWADPEWGYLSRETFNFNSQYTDPTLIRDALSYDVFAMLGVPASRTRFVHLRVNDEYYGVMLDIENPRKQWLKHMGYDNDGVLYTANNNRFQTLDTPADYDGPFTKQTREEEPFDDLHTFISTVNNLADEDVFAGLRALMKMNDFRRYMVGNAVISQQRHLRHNYLLYYDDDDSMEWMIIPWDHDFTWGRQIVGSNKLFFFDLMYDSPIDWGNWDVYPDGNKLMTKFLNDEQFVAEYKEEIRNTLDTIFTEEIWNAKITEYTSLIHDDAMADPNKLVANDEYDGFVQDLRDYIIGRRAYLAGVVGP